VKFTKEKRRRGKERRGEERKRKASGTSLELW
jgi:hypothetical protein